MTRGKELSRSTVTVASRIMVPTYVAQSVWFAFVYLFDPQGRLERSPTVALFQHIGAPLATWGLLMSTLVAIYAYALVTRSRQAFVFGLYCHMVVMIWWFIIHIGSVFVNDEAALSSVAWPLIVAIACHASAKSLLVGETR